MMITSSLPAFEIPTGLMATGLNGLRGFGRGLGAVNVESLAQAMVTGRVNPQFLPPQSFQPSYLPAGQLATLPTWLYATQGFAQQLAGYLGGSVVQAQPPGDYNGTGIPNAYWVQLPDGSLLLPGNLFQPGTVLSFSDLCTAENYLTNSIPGSEFGSSCGTYASSTPNPLVGSGGEQAPAAPPLVQQPAPVPQPASQPVETPVTVSNPAGVPTTILQSAQTCSQIAADIANLQAQGLSNIVIWNAVATQAPGALSCPTAQALNPTADIYSPAPQATQPGTMNPAPSQQTQQTSQPATGSNTALYLGIAAVIALVVLGGQK